jgi:cyclic beta-1,2-glucan synthetase
MNIYKVEPYVMAADVYASISHEGRGGWTWYTGAAGWMYSFLVGSFVGMKLEKDSFNFQSMLS